MNTRNSTSSTSSSACGGTEPAPGRVRPQVRLRQTSTEEPQRQTAYPDPATRPLHLTLGRPVSRPVRATRARAVESGFTLLRTLGGRVAFCGEPIGLNREPTSRAGRVSRCVGTGINRQQVTGPVLSTMNDPARRDGLATSRWATPKSPHPVAPSLGCRNGTTLPVLRKQPASCRQPHWRGAGCVREL